MELYWSRDERAIEETDRKYGAFLFRIAYNVLHDRADSEECRNDVYLGVWNAIPPTRPAVFPAFLTQLARRIAVNRYKEKTAQKRVPSELTLSLDELSGALTEGDAVEKALTARELETLIGAFVEELNGRQRYIFIERYYMASPVGQIAEELSVGNATVYREIDRIKEALKDKLKTIGVIV